MNRLVTLAAVVLLLICSCTSNNEDDSLSFEEKTQISFSVPVMYDITRAYPGPLFGSQHTVTVGEMRGSVYDINENFTVYGRRYSGAYQGWDAANSEPIFGVTDATGMGNADCQEVAYVAGNTADGWYPQYPYFFFGDYNYTFSAVSPAKTDIQTNMLQPVNEDNFVCDDSGLVLIHYNASNKTTKSENTASSEEERHTFDNHYDLMYSDRVYDTGRGTNVRKPGNGNANYNGVDTKFHHALASVHFKLCVDPDFVKVYNANYGQGSIYNDENLSEKNFKLLNIRIENIRETGNFYQNITQPTSTSALTEENTKGAPFWAFPNNTDYGAQSTYYFFVGGHSSTDADYKNVKLPDAVKQNTIAKAATFIQNTDTKGNPYDNADGGLIFDQDITGRYGLMIPQTFRTVGGNIAQSPAAQLVVEWSYTYITGNNRQPFTEKFETRVNMGALTKAWEMGKRYVYTLVLKGKLMQVAPSVEVWDDASHNIEI